MLIVRGLSHKFSFVCNTLFVRCVDICGLWVLCGGVMLSANICVFIMLLQKNFKSSFFCIRRLTANWYVKAS